MQSARIVTDGSARDSALKRRNAAMREASGIDPAPLREVGKPLEPRADEKPTESSVSSRASGSTEVGAAC